MDVQGRRALIVVPLLAVVFAAVWLRAHDSDARWFWIDEAATQLHVAGRTAAEIDAHPPATLGALADALRQPAPGGAARVVHALAVDDPQHPPTFYLLERAWQDVGGQRLGIRLPAIAIGIGATAAIAWFAATLGGLRAGIIALALAAVSPFLVLYSREMREYSLLCGLVALASGALVLAVRSGGGRWAGYALATAGLMWSSPLGLLILPAHLIYAAFCGGARRAGAAALAQGFALLAYGPWIAVMVAGWPRIQAGNVWSAGPYPAPALFLKFAFTLSSAFTDLVYLDPRWAIVSALVIAIVAACAIALARADRPAFLLLAATALASGVSLVVVDLVMNSHRSTGSRYLAATVVVTIVAVACAMARAPRRLAATATVAMFILGAGSSAVATLHPVWWDNHGDAGLRDIAAELAKMRDPDIAYEGPCSSLMALALAAPAATIVHCRDKRPAGDGTLVLSPTPEYTRTALAQGLRAVPLVRRGNGTTTFRAFRRAVQIDDDPSLVRMVRTTAVVRAIPVQEAPASGAMLLR